MKVELLKNLIKESVREVLKEELEKFLNENFVKEKEKEIKEVFVQKNNISTKKEPLTSFNFSKNKQLNEILQSTRQEMSSQDFSNVMNFTTENLNSNTNQNFTFDSNNIPRPQPGLDISNLDFVNKAAAVYNASLQKDKQRLP